MRTMNDVNAVYDQGLMQLKNKLFVCPVCKKTYSNELAGIKHVNKRGCYKMEDVVAGTVHETKGYALYQTLVAELQPNAKVDLKTFRKSPLFNGIMRFTMFCSLHSVFSVDVYLSWLNEIKKLEQINTILKEAVKEDNLREFRIFAQKHALIPSDLFYSRYRDDLIEDDEFFIRSIEKAQVGVTFLATQPDFPFEERLDRLPLDYKNRATQLFEAIL